MCTHTAIVAVLFLQALVSVLGRVFCLPHNRRPTSPPAGYSYGSANRFVERGFTSMQNVKQANGFGGKPTSTLRPSKSRLKEMRSAVAKKQPSPQLDFVNSTETNKLCRSLQTQIARIEQSLQCVGKQNEDIFEAIRGNERVKMVRLRKYEWQNFAAALDRLFFVLFIFAIIFSLLFLFPRAENKQGLVNPQTT